MRVGDGVLQGEKVRLRPLEERDIPLLVRWFSDPEVRHWLFLSEDPPELMTPAAHRERYQRMRDDPAALSWIIETEQGRPVGNIDLSDIHPLHRRAELAVTIGEKECWGSGYGAGAVRRLLRLAFEELGLLGVWLSVDEDNQRAIRCYERCGFRREGLLRAHRLRRGEPVNMVVMGVLRQELEGQPWR